ncbi:hypothetical protein ABZU32_30930 [Sphaerisporangium sp. NPDC005288]|uniref:hypothetical protein n=1 Tax=Sphaerisporangium sp. NPDC005288 TaxID=3155114 RepID=UPI0033B2C51B
MIGIVLAITCLLVAAISLHLASGFQRSIKRVEDLVGNVQGDIDDMRGGTESSHAELKKINEDLQRRMARAERALSGYTELDRRLEDYKSSTAKLSDRLDDRLQKHSETLSGEVRSLVVAELKRERARSNRDSSMAENAGGVTPNAPLTVDVYAHGENEGPEVGGSRTVRVAMIEALLATVRNVGATDIVLDGQWGGSWHVHYLASFPSRSSLEGLRSTLLSVIAAPVEGEQRTAAQESLKQVIATASIAGAAVALGPLIIDAGKDSAKVAVLTVDEFRRASLDNVFEDPVRLRHTFGVMEPFRIAYLDVHEAAISRPVDTPASAPVDPSSIRRDPPPFGRDDPVDLDFPGPDSWGGL